MAAEHLRHHHFSFLRAELEMLNLRKAWERYLAFEGGPDDERHFAARVKQLQALVRTAADERGLGHLAQRAFAAEASEPVSATSKSPPARVLPTLDQWVEERCMQWGVERDFQSEADWLAEYQAEFGPSADDDQPQVAVPATALVHKPAEAGPSSAFTRSSRIEALNILALELARPPQLEDGLGSWLSPELAGRLSQARVANRPMALLTVGNLIDFINLHHYRWFRHVPRLGETRAQRLVQWLEPLAQALGRPLRESALRPHSQLALEIQRQLQTMQIESTRRFGLVPLDRLEVPPDLDGHNGVFRPAAPNVLGVSTDLQAIFVWLERHKRSPHTYTSYSRIVERFYLWCVLIKRKPMSSLVERDFQDYRQFVSQPPPDWVQSGPSLRASDQWRPFKGPLSPPTAQLNFTVISTLLSALVQAGYLTANAAACVVPAMRLPYKRLQVDRSFGEQEWRWIMHCWRERYRRVGPLAQELESMGLYLSEGMQDQSFLRAALLRRTRLVLELGATTGLRLAELTSTLRSALKQEQINGVPTWIMSVTGKGNREREVVVPHDVVELLEQHHRDMERAHEHFDLVKAKSQSNSDAAMVTASGTQDSSGGSLTQSLMVHGAVNEHRGLPLIGALRPQPRRWTLSALGVRVLESQERSRANRHGRLEPSSLYGSLKRFLLQCAVSAKEMNAPGIDPERLQLASTHWLRHFFANSAAEDGVGPAALMRAMGHSSLQTTSVYLRTERHAMVRELAKLKRRG